MIMNINVINECATKKLSFPDSIRRLSEIGIERYYVDLMKMEKTYYSGGGESYVEKMPIADLPLLGNNFDKEKITETIPASQAGQIDYHTFIRYPFRQLH